MVVVGTDYKEKLTINFCFETLLVSLRKISTMTTTYNTINIGKGLNNILFGIKRADLKALLGEPNEKELYNTSEDDDYQTEDWHYDELEISFSFDEEDGWKLTSIGSSSPDIAINGKKLMGMSLDEVIDATENMNLGDNELVDLSEDDGNQQLLSFLESSINFWFEDNELTEIQWGVQWTDEDTPKWP